MEKLIQLDERLFLYLNHLGNARWDGFWLFVTAERAWIPLYGLLALLLVWKLGWMRGGLALLSVLLLFGFTDQFTGLVKHFFHRPRPCYDAELSGLVRLVTSHCGGRYGFTSGHAGNAFGLAGFVVLVFRRISRWIYAMWLWAAVVAYSRVYLGVHFPLDILCGGLFGVVSACLFYRLYVIALDYMVFGRPAGLS
ncbi:MAG: phosphatase PAP2 family protein [Flavobacteriales bacterium]